MLKLIIKRQSQNLYQTDVILDHDLDGISLSGIDYFSQEDRSCKLKLVYNDELQHLLDGDGKSVAAGFHCLVFYLFYKDSLIYTGVLKDGGYSIGYLNLSDKVAELELTDLLGLLLILSERREYELSAQFIDPISTISDIMTAVFNPMGNEIEDYSNEDVRNLIQSLGSLNAQHAHLYYNYGGWQPVWLNNRLLLDARTLYYDNSANSNKRFGFIEEAGEYYLVYWEYFSRDIGSVSEYFRWRKYRLLYAEIELVESIEAMNAEVVAGGYPYPIPGLLSPVTIGDGTYHTSSHRAYYSGPVAMNRVEVVPGWYKAKDLIGEYLRLGNAVIYASNYMFYIKNRIEEDRAILSIFDPLEAEITADVAEISEIRSVSAAEESLIDDCNRQYRQSIASMPFEARIVLHELLPEMNGVDIDEMIWMNLDFDGWRIYSLGVSHDLKSGEIEITGRARRMN